ncbi:MAG: hypothetical protein KIT73_00320 [Burkholderiales bacterium]|nr:hypothetical protein [Burkholderiales bacterium]
MALPTVSTRTRRILIFGALGLTLLAMRWVDERGAQLSSANAAAERSAQRDGNGEAERGRDTPPSRSGRDAARGAATPAPGASPLDLTRLERRSGSAKPIDAFGTRSWEAPAPKLTPREAAAREAAAAPAPPVAPPLPFTYVGQIGDEDAVTVFLESQERHLAVKSGDVVDGMWRVDTIDARQVVFTYLPLSQRQTLSFASE